MVEKGSRAENGGEAQGLWTRVSQRAQEFGWVAGAIAIMASAIGVMLAIDLSQVVRDFIGIDEAIDRRLSQDVAPQCVYFPTRDQLNDRYHTVTDVVPGERAVVSWFNLERRGDCGKACITAWVNNGKRISHRVETTLGDGECPGARLPEGVNPLTRYAFEVPTDVEPGCARFYVDLNFENGRFQRSPQLRFHVLNPDGSAPSELCPIGV